MQMTEEKYDRLLHIRTTGRDDSHSDQYRFPYEPTPYSVLERLPMPAISEKEILFWTMAAAKVG